LFDSPVWNPAVAAGSGAGFAGVLGAIVVAVTFQIVLVEPRKREYAPGRVPSLAVASVTVTLTLTAAYLYVVLSGTAPIVDATIDCARDMSAVQCHEATQTPIWVSASMFAIGGSYLGLGAIGLAATLLFVVREHAIRETPMVQTGVLLFFTAGSLITFSALVWGYRDADWVLRNERITASYYFFGRGGWLGMVAGLAVGAMLAVFHRRDRLPKLLALFLLHLHVVAPVVWYLIIEGTPPGEKPIGSDVISQVMLGWVAVGFGFLAASIDREVWSDLVRMGRERAVGSPNTAEPVTSPAQSPIRNSMKIAAIVLFGCLIYHRTIKSRRPPGT